MNDSLAAALSNVLNYEKTGKKECLIKPVSKIIKKVFDVMKENNFVGDYQIIEDGRGGIMKITLLGNINKCGAVKPRHSVTMEEYEKFEKRYLPAKNFGVLIISTPKGIMTHIQSKNNNIGGKLLAYCY